MSFFTDIYNTILVDPILNFLIIVYNALPWADMGIAIIVVTLVIRLALYPLSQKSLKAQKALQELQPKLNEIKEKYKDDKQAQAQKTMEFYQKNKVNPFGSCLPLIIQLPIFFAIYQVFRTGLDAASLGSLYSFVPQPETVNTVFLGLVNLSEANVVLAILAGLAQFAQSKLLMSKRKPQKSSSDDTMADMSNMLSKQMTYFMPAITIFIGLSLPAALTLYWVTTTIFAAVQQLFVNKSFSTEKQ